MKMKHKLGTGIYSWMIFIIITGLLVLIYLIGFLHMDPQQIYRMSADQNTVPASISIIPLRSDENILAGQQVFQQACVACHGQIGNYVPGLLGPNLIDNEWLHESQETNLYKLISQGIAAGISVSGNVMPARGGVPLRDEQLWQVIYYLSSLNTTIVQDSTPTEAP